MLCLWEKLSLGRAQCCNYRWHGVVHHQGLFTGTTDCRSY
jgi:hypothetical protein